MVTRRVVTLTEFGSPEVLSVVTEELPAPMPNEVRVRQTAIGFNFIDIYQRKGIYPLPTPTGLGFEAAGVVDALGSDVTGLRVGDRVAYMNAGVGAYADFETSLPTSSSCCRTPSATRLRRRSCSRE